jgi:HAD superfamily hydrolase (TIGR01662 family)
MLKAVLFDVDGVLVDSKKANVDLFQSLLIKAGYPKPSEDKILKCFHMSLWQTLEELTGTKDSDEIHRVREIIKDSEFRASRDVNLFEFPIKLEEILQELHQKYRLGIVTNRMRIGVDDIFNLREIQHLFDAVITVEKYKNPKPHPEPLLVAIKELEISADEAIYIGDSDTDVEAARLAGMRCIHLSLKKHDDASAGVKEFAELISVIESLA